MFQPAPRPNIYANPFGSAPTAVMWIFSPRNYSNQARRPFLYNFTPSFLEEAERAVSLKSAHQNASRLDVMTRSPAYASALRPAFMPDHTLDMSYISRNWTFMLITTNDRSVDGVTTNQMSDCQHLYYGYFVEEPVNPMVHSSQVTPNPHANLIITHKTFINKAPNVGPHGQQPRLDLMADVDLINAPSMAVMTNGVPTTLLRPEDLINNVGSGYGADTVVLHNPHGQLSATEGQVPISANLSVPRHHITKLLNAVSDAQETVGHRTYEATSLNAINHDTFSSQLEQNMRDGIHLHTQGLPINQQITLGRVLQQYQPKLNVLDQERNPRYDPIDQTTGSARNVFGSMLSTVVPAIMVNYMLAEVTFSYNSHINDFNVTAPPAGITEFPQFELQRRMHAFLHCMKTEILPIPKMTHGDFSLDMHCTCGGISYVNINFLDDAIASPEVFEVPTILGGFNSALVGSNNVFTQNTGELSLLIAGLSDSDRDQPSLSSYDQKQLGQALTRYDTSSPQGRPDQNVPVINPPNKWGV